MKEKRAIRASRRRARPKTWSCFWHWPWGHLWDYENAKPTDMTLSCVVPRCTKTIDWGF